MKVMIIKVHPTWNAIYKDEFKTGDIVDLTKGTITTKSGLKFDGCDLTKCFSNGCSYSEIFKKID